MPLRNPKVLFFERPCAQDGCVHNSSIQITVDGEHLISSCLNHTFMVVERLADVRSSQVGCVVGQSCSGPSVDIDDGDWQGTLCRGHVIAYLTRSLNPSAFRRIVHDAGGDPELVHALHGDFYDHHGVARQPSPIRCERTHSRVRQLGAMPDFDDDGEFAVPAQLHDELLTCVREDYQDLTGLLVDDEVAINIYSGLLVHESLRRQGVGQDRLEDYRDAMVQRLERLYLDADPQGLVALHGAEPNPYAKNARDLGMRMHGQEEDASVERIQVKIAQSFGDYTYEPEDTKIYRPLAERIVEEVAVPAMQFVARQGR